jgi:hypothetical protein
MPNNEEGEKADCRMQRKLLSLELRFKSHHKIVGINYKLLQPA